MKWVNTENIEAFINAKNFDLRISHNGRWLDQKCTADVLTINADCIIEYIDKNNSRTTFTRKDIQFSDYTCENVKLTFKKPGTDELVAKSEYDKFFSQPLELFTNAGILSKTKKGHSNLYKVLHPEILTFIALREKNALAFLQIYIKRVLMDTDIWYSFQQFFEKQTSTTYQTTRKLFFDTIKKTTKINGNLECGRIFPKVMNPLAYERSLLGSRRGCISKDIITLDELMYNRYNFRDIYSSKPKDIARKAHAKNQKTKPNKDYFKYLSAKARKILRNFNDIYRKGLPEVSDNINEEYSATTIHHIFSESEYQEISYYLENLIALTPTQHYNGAHNGFKTNENNEIFQHICLLAKADHIQLNLKNSQQEDMYNFDDLLYVLNVGLNTDIFKTIKPMDFESIIIQINLHYK